MKTTIHEIIKDKTQLAEIYAEDGAFYSSARVLRDLAKVVQDHAEGCASLETFVDEKIEGFRK